ncbi:Gmad2 immunoglobulin-like domain-containing protein [Patescibacteria group bacterium]
MESTKKITLLLVIISILVVTIVALSFYFIKATSQVRDQIDVSQSHELPTEAEVKKDKGDKPVIEDEPIESFLEIIAPIENQVVTSPVMVSGKSNFNEANTRIRIKDSDGDVLADTFTTAEGWMDKLYPFSKSVEYSAPENKNGVVEVFEESAKDGSEINKVLVNVVFGDYSEVQWMEYKNSDPKYSVMYPSDWTVDSSKAVLGKSDPYQILKFSIEKDGYKFILTIPSAWGPGVCAFDGDNLSNFDGPMAGDFKGSAVEVGVNEGAYKRLDSHIMDMDGKNATWSICYKQKGEQYFVSSSALGFISYEAPKNYDKKMIGVLDEILKTISTK